MDPNSVLLASLLAVYCADHGGSASQQLQKEYYKRSGIEQELKDLERKHVSQEVKFYMSPAIFISKTIIERKIVFTWSF